MTTHSALQVSEAPVLVFGEVLADVFPQQRVLGGAPYNFSCHLQRFGQAPLMISAVGKDALGDDILAAMRGHDLLTAGVQRDPGHPSGQVLVHMQGGQHRFEIVPEQAYDHINATAAHVLALTTRPRLVYFGTLAQRHPASRQALHEVLGQVRAKRFLDINLRQPWYQREVLHSSLQLADLVKLNEEELVVLARELELSGEHGEQHARQLLERYDLDSLLVTCGGEGAWHMQRGGALTHVGSGPVPQLVDTVGAGDAFAAVYVLGHLLDWPLTQTLARADEFARAICGIRGGVPQQPAFYASFLQQWELKDAIDA